MALGLTDLSVKRGVTFSMIFIIVIGFGIFSLSRLRLDMYPDITFPMVGVVTQYEGAGPKEIEDLITRRIEGALTAVEGVKEVSSTSKQGASIVMVEFDWGTDLNQAEIDIRKNIDFIEGLLPEDAKDPIAFAFDPSMQPIVFMGLSGPYSEVKLREIAEEKVEPLLERLPGVASVDTVGGGKREILVQIDPRRLGAAKVTPQQVVTALRMDNVQLPGGTFDQGGWQFTIQTKGRFTSVKQIESTVVGLSGMVPVRLRDVATVTDGLREQTNLVRNNGRPGIMIIARKQSDANTVQAVRSLLKALPEVERKAGRGVKLSVIFDQGDFIEKSIGNLSSTAMIAFLIAFFVLLFFLRSLRSSLIVAGAIPISVVATFSIMDTAGLTLNIISMAGLALAIGMLVDNSIVVLENIYAHTESGEGGRAAATAGTKEVATAITASTLTTVVVFLPILFVPGIAGEMFGDMAVTICFSLAASLFVARTGIPLAASRLLRGRTAAGDKGPIGRMLAGLTALYARLLAWCLRNRKKTLGLVTLVFAVSMGVGSTLETEFFPKTDNSIITMQIDGIEGSSLEQTDAAFRRMERIVERVVPERKALNVDIGSGEGFVALFAKGPHSGIMRIRLKDRAQRSRGQQEIEEDLRKRFNAIPGITATAMQPNFFGSADVVVEIYGHDLFKAREIGMKVKEIVEGVKGTRDVVFSLESGKPEYEVLLDRKRLAALGLNTAAVSASISTFYAGTLASVFREGGYEYDIRVRGPRTMRRDQRDLHNLSIVTPTGVTVPLASIANVRPSVGPAAIARKNQQRMVTVSCSVPGGNMGSVVKDLGVKLKAFPWPEDFNHYIGGQAEDFKESFLYLGLALLASILLVYMVMASQFESLLHPFLILFTIPLAMVGVVVSLGLTGTNLSVVALIGVLILVGLVVNNAIVLVDTINQYRQRKRAEREAGGDEVQPDAPYRASSHGASAHQDLVDCVLEAGKRRLRPILMTALTTSLGLVPLAMEIGEGAESWSPMARAVIGGLASSTLLTLIVIPALYTSLESFRIKRQAKRAAKQAAKAAQQDASPA
jgi:hydrophobic/amphiphilic exporter-1 (mainly G- bacteria), HAE1 family